VDTQATILNLVPRSPLPATVRPGYILAGTIEGPPGNQVVAAGALRVPIPQTASLLSGQPVTVEVVETEQGLQLRLTPREPAPPPPATAPPPADPLTAVLKSLGVTVSRDTAEALIPAHLARTEETVRAVLSLFVRTAKTGADLRLIASLLTEGAAAGALSAESADEVATLIEQFVARSSEDLSTVLYRLTNSAGKDLEARIGQALTPPGHADTVLNLPQNDLRILLSHLRTDQAVAAYLRGAGRDREFQDAVDRTLGRLSAAQLQNVHALDQPYLFLEIPWPAGAPIHEARVHFFAEGRTGKRGPDAQNASVTLDLSTTRLGDLWITLQLVAGRCQCRFCATSPDAVETIERATEELTQALEDAGYPQTTIQVTLWDGDRLREMANLMRRFSGIDLKV